MLYLHVDPIMGHGYEFQVTYTTVRSISEWFTFMWILNWVKNLNLKSHIQQLQAFRNALPSCGSFYGSWIWIQSYIYNNVFLVLVSHITKIQRVEMNHGLMLHLSMSGTVFVVIAVSMFLLEDPVLGMNGFTHFVRVFEQAFIGHLEMLNIMIKDNVHFQSLRQIEFLLHVSKIFTQLCNNILHIWQI